jgi:hypothetical protein
VTTHDLRRVGNFSKPLEERDVDNLGSQTVNRVSECYSMIAPKDSTFLKVTFKASQYLMSIFVIETTVSDSTQLPETEMTLTTMEFSFLDSLLFCWLSFGFFFII